MANKSKAYLLKIHSLILNFFSKLAFFRKRKKEADFDNGREQSELDKKLVFSLSKSRIPSLKQLSYINNYLSPKERLIIIFSALIILGSLFTAGYKFYATHLQVVPVKGGKYIEGLIGAPKNINPLYAGVNDVDNDIVHLVYSGLFRRDKSGALVKDLAADYEVSEDGKTYTFSLKPDVRWHDDVPLTADDVIFTFNAIKDVQYKSPLRSGFIGVDVERIDDHRFKFVLTDPYAAFLDLLTFGIMPVDIWSQIPPESASLYGLNLKPVGSGPYKFLSLVRDEKTGAVKEYNLTINEDYYGMAPRIDIGFRFFASFEEAVEALNNKAINGISYLPRENKEDIITPKTYNYHKLYLPQLTLIYLNQKKNPALGDKAVRQALFYAIDRNGIINDVLSSDAYSVNGPILPSSFAYNETIEKYEYNREKAGELLDNTDWKLVEITEEIIAEAEINKESSDEKARQKAETILSLGLGKWRQKNDEWLVVSLATVERGENQSVIELVKKYWEEAGVKTVLEVLPAKRIQTEIIKPRNFEALFYGQVVGADPDPYAFWHSSQAVENGFNVADYTNKEVDQLLEDARIISDQAARREKYRKFQEIISEEAPVIFMYSPVYVYVQDKSVNGFEVIDILYPYDRLSNIHEWYLKTGKKLIWQ
ncbi:MAG: ABC transporter substrate-binding protein [Candidatus Falkowbacteria bacterium]